MSNVCKLPKNYQYHVQFHVQYFFSESVTTAYSNCTIFFQECFEIPLNVFISMKIESNHGGNFQGLKKLEILVHKFLCALFGACVHHHGEEIFIS